MDMLNLRLKNIYKIIKKQKNILLNEQNIEKYSKIVLS